MVKSVEARRGETRKPQLPMPLACMRNISELDKLYPPRHKLMQDEVERMKKKGLTLVYRSLPDEYKPKNID